jgi:hypothetical protein
MQDGAATMGAIQRSDCRAGELSDSCRSHDMADAKHRSWHRHALGCSCHEGREWRQHCWRRKGWQGTMTSVPHGVHLERLLMCAADGSGTWLVSGTACDVAAQGEVHCKAACVCQCTASTITICRDKAPREAFNSRRSDTWIVFRTHKACCGKRAHMSAACGDLARLLAASSGAVLCKPRCPRKVGSVATTICACNSNA